MSGPFFPGYDAWKLRSSDDERDDEERPCPDCAGFGVIEDGDEEFDCPECGGEGRIGGREAIDPDYARDLEREKDW